jgi:protease IV
MVHNGKSTWIIFVFLFMKTFVKYLITLLGGFALGIISIALVFGFLFSGLSSKIGSNENTVLTEASILNLTIVGDVSERTSNNPLNDLLTAGGDTNPSVGLNDIINGLKKAASDNNVKGIYLDCGGYAGGMATAEEIRNAILGFRKSGKPVVAYSGLFSEMGYYIASACDKIICNPKGMLEIDGISSKFVMYKGLFDKLGVDFQVFRVGKFKSAVEPFIQNKMSEENRFQVTQYITSLYRYQMEQVAKSRKLPVDSLWSIAMNAKAQMPKDALKLRLIDAMNYETEAKADLAKTCKLNPEKAKWFAFGKYAKDADPYEYSENKIAVIYAVGDILPGKQNPDEQIGSTSFIKTLHKAQNDPDIKAIVIRINSPGGSAYASDEMAHEIIACKKVKPVIVSFGDVSASGGYYMGCVADSIFALPNTITGSIGVFALLPNTQQLFGEKLGLNYETVDLGSVSAGWRPDRELNEKEKAMMQNMINSIYDDFITTVAMGRKMTKERVAELAEGRVYSAVDAKAVGLIDDFGGLNRAIVSAARKSKIKEYRVVSLPEQEDWLSQLFNQEEIAKTQWSAAAKSSGLPVETIKEAQKIQYLQGPQYLLPWSVKMH